MYLTERARKKAPLYWAKKIITSLDVESVQQNKPTPNERIA